MWRSHYLAGTWVRVKESPCIKPWLVGKLVKLLELEGDCFWRAHVRGRKGCVWVYESEVTRDGRY
jgi:hypothetical protein